MDRGYTGKFRIQLVPSYVDYEAQKVKRRKTRAPVLLNRRTHHNTKADDARGADKDVDGFLWSFNNDDEKHSKRARKIASSYWDKFRPEVWVEFICSAGIGFRFYLGVLQELMPATRAHNQLTEVLWEYASVVQNVHVHFVYKRAYF